MVDRGAQLDDMASCVRAGIDQQPDCARTSLGVASAIAVTDQFWSCALESSLLREDRKAPQEYGSSERGIRLHKALAPNLIENRYHLCLNAR